VLLLVLSLCYSADYHEQPQSPKAQKATRERLSIYMHRYLPFSPAVKSKAGALSFQEYKLAAARDLPATHELGIAPGAFSFFDTTDLR
jgi:hypothetical protein